jgi:hypothetical protein
MAGTGEAPQHMTVVVKHEAFEDGREKQSPLLVFASRDEAAAWAERTARERNWEDISNNAYANIRAGKYAYVGEGDVGMSYLFYSVEVKGSFMGGRKQKSTRKRLTRRRVA